MGKIVLREIRYMQRQLELSAEDLEKQKKRKALRNEMELNPKPTRHELRFSEKLEKCPFCGKGVWFQAERSIQLLAQARSEARASQMERIELIPGRRGI